MQHILVSLKTGFICSVRPDLINLILRWGSSTRTRMVSRRKILSRSRDDLTLGEERTKHTQVDDDDDGDDDGNGDDFYFDHLMFSVPFLN